MVTDEQYKALKERVDQLESKLYSMGRELDRLIMKKDKEEIGNYKYATKSNSKSRDTTKYMLDGKRYFKRGIVLAIIKKFVSDQGIVKFEELQNVFPDYLQGPLGVIRLAEDAERYSDAVKRYYFADEDIIHLEGKSYVVCSQWDAKNISKFLAVATNYYQIQKINY